MSKVLTTGSVRFAEAGICGTGDGCSATSNVPECRREFGAIVICLDKIQNLDGTTSVSHCPSPLSLSLHAPSPAHVQCQCVPPSAEAMGGCYGWLLWVVAMGGCYGWLLCLSLMSMRTTLSRGFRRRSEEDRLRAANPCGLLKETGES